MMSRSSSASSSSVDQCQAQAVQAYPVEQAQPVDAWEQAPAKQGWASSTSSNSVAPPFPRGGWCGTQPPKLAPITQEALVAVLEPANAKAIERVKKAFTYAQEVLKLAKLVENSPALAALDIPLGYGLSCDGELLLDEMPFLAELNEADENYSVQSGAGSQELMGWSRGKVMREVRISEAILEAAGCVDDHEAELAFVMISGSKNMPEDPETAIGEIYARLANALKE